MSYRNARTSQRIARRAWMTRIAALTGACIVWLQPAPHAHGTMPPSVPVDVEVPSGNHLFRVGHAIGTQNYMCLPSTTKPPVDWQLLGPQATLFNDHGRQIMTHFQSPNPDEDDLLRPTWQDSRDTTAVWAARTVQSDDPLFVEPDAIPWLRLHVVGRDFGPTPRLGVARATYVQRLNTSGGKAPATGCSDTSNIGKREQIPYTADYFFYRSNEPLD